jgi:hypothetical protein
MAQALSAAQSQPDAPPHRLAMKKYLGSQEIIVVGKVNHVKHF